MRLGLKNMEAFQMKSLLSLTFFAATFGLASFAQSVDPAGTAILNTNFPVTAYGAYVDGSHATETTAAFNAALVAAAAAPGGTVIVPAGTFGLTAGSIQILNNIPTTNIQGASNGKSILSFSGPGDAIFVGSSTTTPVFTQLNLRDLEIEGNSSATNGLHIYNTGDITLDRVTIDGFTNDGLLADSAQYIHVNDSYLSANANWGLDALPPRSVPGVRNNTFLFTNTFFIANGTPGSSPRGGGYRLVAAREITFIGCTIQANAYYGGVDTGDVTGAIGGLPPGTSSGAFSDDIRHMSTHYEFNGYKNHDIQFAQSITDIHPVFGSSTATGGDFYVENSSIVSLVTNLVLINPYFTSVGPNITVPGGAQDDIELGNASSVAIAYGNLRNSLVHAGGSIYSTTYGSNIDFQPGAFVVGDPADVTLADTLTLQRAGVALKSNSPSYGIDLYPQGSTNQFTVVGTPTTRRMVTLPDASGTVAYTSQLPLAATSGSIGGSALAAGQCASGTVAVAGASTGMAAMASAAGGSDPGDGFDARAVVSGAGTAVVKVCALVAGTPASATYNVRVLP
jgi:hypothetical protein